MSDGELMLWGQLRKKNPTEICTKAQVQFDRDRNEYSIPVFKERVRVTPADESINGEGGVVRRLIEGHGEHFRLATLAYLVQAKGVPLSGDIVSPSRTPGGRIYEEGAHKLPLPVLARPFADNKDGFSLLTDKVGGVPMDSGDVSVKVFPFPLVPITFVLWERDEEFAEQLDIFFDRSSPGQFAPDVLWSIAVATVEMLIDLAGKDK